MADVTLVLKADNANLIKGLRQVQDEQEKLYKRHKENYSNANGYIVQQQKELEKLLRWRLKAENPEIVKDYNKAIAEQVKKLNELNKIEEESVKATESMGKSVSKWALSLGGVTAILGALWSKMKEFTVVINAQNIALAAYNQVLYNITTNQASWIHGVVEAIKVQDKLNTLRLKEYKEVFQAQQQRTKFQNAWYEALNDELSLKERIVKADEAMAAKEAEVAIKRQNAQERLSVNLEKILLQQGTEENVKEFWAARAELEALDAEVAQSTKRLFNMRKGLINQQKQEQMQAWFDEIEADNKAYAQKLELQKKYQDLSKRLLEEYEKSNIESLSGGARIIAQRNFALKQIEDFKKEILAVGKLTVEQEQMIAVWTANVIKAFGEELKKETPEKVETKNIYANFVDELLTPDTLKAPAPGQKPMSILQMMGIDPDTDQGRAQLEALKQVKETIINTFDEIYQARVDDATRNRELIDTRIDETQNELNSEIELYEAGYASNVAAKKKQLEDLKKQREIALKKEEEAIKKQRQLETLTQASALVTASAQTFKAFPGPLLPIAIAVIAAMWTAFAATKIKAAEMTKLATGGSGSDTGIVTGKSHAKGGERFLSQVEVERGEAWGVLNIPATQKFGKIFHHMVSSFNKGEIPNIISNSKVDNNVLVENSGPNRRLDRVIEEQKKLNTKLSGEIIQEYGMMRMIKKGNSIRIIKR